MGGGRDQCGSLQREEESCEDDNNAAGSDRLRIDSGKKHKNKKPVVEEEREENYSDSESESGSDPASESEENDRRSRRRSGKRERKSRKRHSRSRSRSYDLGSDSESDSGSGSEESDGEIESESEDGRRRKKKERKRRREREEKKRRRREKEKRRRKEREEEEEERRRKKRKKKKKEKEKKKREKVERGKTGAVTNSWGKYGIIRETDMWNKRPEFTAWLAEVKQVNLEHLANWEEKQMFKEFMEDHNTATFPSKKYYNLDAYYKRQMEKEMKKGAKNVQETERTVFNDEEQRRQELLRDREKQKEAEVEALKLSMRSGMAQAMKEQAQLREQMAYLYKLGKFEEAAAIQRRLDPDVPM